MWVYEHGIAVEGHDGSSTAHLRPIATNELPVYAGFSLTLVDHAALSLNQRIVQLSEVRGPHTTAEYYREKDLSRGLLAVAYHLEQIVERYRGVAELFERQHHPASVLRGNTSEPRVYYEIDAFLGAARRWFELLRRLLWRHFGSGSEPRSFGNLLTSQIQLPEEYKGLLDSAWQEYGEHLTSYRDCIMHNDPLNDGSTTCWLKRRLGLWGVTVRLPSNPETKSRSRFDFESGPDALEYCHRVLCKLTEVAEATVSTDQIREHLDHPA